MTGEAQAELAAKRAGLRRNLAALDFADDGETLRGPVRWQAPDGRPATALVDITVTDRYPFGPPVVRLVDPGAPLTVTFHRDLDGGLCLWDTTEPAAVGPWTDPALLLRRVAGWLEHTAAGWPGDEDCDLERYLHSSDEPAMVLYDYDTVRPLLGYLRTSAAQAAGAVTVLATEWRPPARSARGKGTRGRKAPAPTAPRRLAYAADLGAVQSPIREWADIEVAIGDDANDLRRLINQGSVELLLLWYRRGQREAALVLTVGRGHPPVLKACEAADTSVEARTLRAGIGAADLAGRRVAIVGCGAVGSHVADLLYREGIRHLDLIDAQLLRPGNVIRHLAPLALVGLPKVDAVRQVLLGYELGRDSESEVQARRLTIASPDQAVETLAGADLVIDATADQRATAMLCWAAAATARPLVTVCVQGEGGIARADRFPLRGGEEHLPPVPPALSSAPVRERGCGDAVSLTPPSAVVAAAELAVELGRSELADRRIYPATILRVLSPQPDQPYDRPGTLISGGSTALRKTS